MLTRPSQRVSPCSPFSRGFLTCQRGVDGAGPTQVLHGDSGHPAEAQSRHVTLPTSGKKGHGAGCPRTSPTEGLPCYRSHLLLLKPQSAHSQNGALQTPAEHVTALLRTSQLRTAQASLRFPARPVPPCRATEQPAREALASSLVCPSHSLPLVMSPFRCRPGTPQPQGLCTCGSLCLKRFSS